ncbi:MAG: PAS domain S-box protein [Chloroflexi bacterium]|nr:PAS domain S-box protein [Chloroflexota bacterium]
MIQDKPPDIQTIESERLIQQAVENMHDALFIIDLRTNELAYANPSISAITGFSPEEIHDIGAEGVIGRVHPDDRPYYLTCMRELLEAVRSTRTPQGQELEYRWLHKDGDYRWFHNSRTVLLDEQGQLLAMVGTFRNVTARKNTEQALQKSESLLREVLENSRDSLYRIDLRTGTYDYFSPVIETLTGYTAEELVGVTMHQVRDRVHPEDRPVYNAHTQALLESADPAPVDTVEYRGKIKEGEYRWFSSSRRLIRDEAGRPAAMVGTLRDITDQKRIEAERERLLVEQERERTLLEAIMENTPAELAYLDRDFCFVRVNSAYERDSGYNREELIGRNHFDLFPNAENQAIFERVRDTGEPVRFDAKPFYYAHQPEKGTTYWDWTLTPVKGPDGRVEGLVLSLLDVTEHERLLADREQRAAELNATLNSIIDGLALYTPDGELRHLNQAGEVILGVTAKEWAAIPPDKRPGRIMAETPDGKPLPPADYPTNRALRGETITGYRMVIHHPDGTPVDLLISVAPIRDTQGNITGVVSTFSDVSPMVILQREVLAERARLEAVLETLPVAVFLADLSGRLTLANRAANDLWGYAPLSQSPEEYSKHYKAWWPNTEQPVQPHEWPLTRAVSQGEVSGPMEMEIETVDGQRKTILDYARPVQDASGAILGGVEVNVDITERKQTEEVLQRYRLLSENAHDIILFINTEGKIIESNLAAERAYGYSRKELATKTVYDLRAGQTGPFVPEQLQRADAEGLTFETLHRHRDGTSFPVEVSSRGVVIGGQRVLVSIIRDITERKQAEEALRESEARFRNVLDNSIDGIHRLNLVTDTYDFLSPAMSDLTGYTEQELVDMTHKGFQRRIHPDDYQGYQEFIHKVITEPNEAHPPMEFRWQRKDGEWRWFSDNERGVTDEKGEVTMMVSVVRDITEQKRATQALQESEERFRQVFANTHDGIYRLNLRTGTYDYINPAVERITGFTYQEFVDMGAEGTVQRIYPEDRQELADYLEGVLSQQLDQETIERSERVEYRWQVKSGAWRWFSEHRALVTTPEGDQTIISSLIDVTERKRAEEALRDLNETLEQRVIERTARLRALALELTLTEERERRRLAQLLHDHLQQLLAAARISVNMVRNRLEDDRQTEILAQVDSLLGESIAESRSLTAELSPPVLYDAGLPPALDWLARWMEEKYHLNVEVQAEELGDQVPEEIRLVLFQGARELLFNVVKHAKTDRARVELRRLPGDQVELIVSDRGVGVDPSQIARQEKGGFGLFNIRERLEALGGEMIIDSEPGKGTQVTLQAPVRPTEAIEEAAARAVTATREVAAIAAEELAAERAEAEQAAAAGVRPVRVLLADDHVIMRQGLARLLEDEPGIELVGQADDGRQVVELAHKVRPDIVLMDVSMPVMDGIEATRRITADMPNVRVIGLSMYEDTEMSERMREAGAVDYVPKGGDPAELVAAVRHAATS